MNDLTESAPARQTSVAAQPWRITALSAVAALMLTAAFVGAGMLLQSSPSVQSDVVAATVRHDRLQTFNALPPLSLQTIAPRDLGKAVQSMQLPADSTQKIQQAASATGTQTASASQPKPLQLVWITLWDTDMEDGDVVRIDSGGYSRTVRLTKHGDTFAVPLPANGVIQVTGIADGDGGGITVGLASGQTKAIFPIMSEGEQLGLKVRID